MLWTLADRFNSSCVHAGVDLEKDVHEHIDEGRLKKSWTTACPLIMYTFLGTL